MHSTLPLTDTDGAAHPHVTAILDRVPTPLAVVDTEWRVITINAAMTDFSGWTTADVAGVDVADFVHASDLARLASALAALRDAAEARSSWAPIRIRVLAKTGAVIPIEVDARPAAGSVLGGFVLTARPVAYEHLITKVLTDVAAGAGLAAVMTDLGTALAAPPAPLDVAIYDVPLGEPPVCLWSSLPVLGELAAADLARLGSRGVGVGPQGRSRQPVRQSPAAMVALPGIRAGEVFHVSCPSPDSTHAIHVVGHCPADAYASTSALHRMVAGRDLVEIVLDRLATDRRLAWAATHDQLTGLLNRVGLGHWYEPRRDDATRLAVMYVDLDTFKPVNDEHGHATGDAVLVEVAGRLARCLGPQGALARYGGDEFVGVLPVAHAPDDDADDAVTEAVSDLVREALAAPVRVGAIEVTVSGSIGWAVAERPGVSLDRLIRRADTAMYVDKRARRRA